MKCSIGSRSVSRWALWLLPLWLLLLCSCTIGSEFSAVEASPAPVLGFAAEAGPGDASTAETSFSETPAVDPPPREDAGVSLEGASEACTPERFQKDCQLWYTFELPSDSPCWEKCGPCPPRNLCLYHGAGHE